MDTSQAESLGSAIATVRPRLIGIIPLLWPILEGLEVRQTVNARVLSEADIDLGRTVVLLVLNRLLDPRPLYQVQDWLADTVLPELLVIAPTQAHDNRLGRALDRLYLHLGELWVQLASRAVQVYDLNLNVLHWDITSIYFEGAYLESELAARGYSRDHRPDTKQINLELDVTHEGYVPVFYRILPGDSADISQPLPHLQALLRFFARPELADRHLAPLLISDGKMITPEAVFAYHRHGLHYLGPLPNGTATDALLRSVSAEELANQQLAYRPQRVRAGDPTFTPYRGVWQPFTFEFKGKKVTDRALVVWSDGKQRLDEQKRKTYLKRLLNALAHIVKKLNTRRYKKRDYVAERLFAVRRGNPATDLVDSELSGADGALQLRFQINRQKLAEVQALDGRYALATNADRLTADETLTLYKGQDGVEKRIGAIKGPLLVHPLYVHTDRRIEGLVFITLLALLVRAILERLCRQRGLLVTLEQLQEEFDSLQAVDVIWRDGSQQRRAAELTTFQAHVLGTLDWPLPPAYARLAPGLR